MLNLNCLATKRLSTFRAKLAHVCSWNFPAGFQYKVHLNYCTMGDQQKTTTVTEGKASIIHPASVFYNPVQEFNRDLTIAVVAQFAKEQIKEKRDRRNKNRDGTTSGDVLQEDEELVPGKKYEDGIRLLEGLSASGLRSMRFGLEVPGLKEVVANDFDINAVEIIKENISRNNLEHLVKVSHADVGMLMYQSKSNADTRFDVIDLDPYGSPAHFLDPCMQAIRGGGLICVTCTDAATLCGNFPEKCYLHYGGMPIRAPFCHEMALRIILHSIQSHAGRYQKYVVPLLSLSVDFYFRLYLKVHWKPSIAKYAASNTGLVYNCTGCGSFAVQPLATFSKTDKQDVKFTPARGPPVPDKCEHCNHEHKIGGPMYTAKIHDKIFVSDLLQYIRGNHDKFNTASRMEGMLTVALEEEEDFPLYYEIDELFKVVHSSPFKMMKFRSAILNAGYKVSFSHACKNSVKTNAPTSLIWDILRTWIKDNPVKDKRLEPGSVAHNIISRKPSTEVSFDLHPDANPASRATNLVRHQPNPQRNWGPKPRARNDQDGDDMEERRLRNQGKRRKKVDECTESTVNNNMESS